MSEAETLRALLGIARAALVEAEAVAASPTKWRSHVMQRLRHSLRLAIAQSEPEPTTRIEPPKVEAKKPDPVAAKDEKKPREKKPLGVTQPKVRERGGWDGHTFRNG